MMWRYVQRPYTPSRDPLSAIPPSRHPFQFWVMFALVLSGLTNFLTPGSEVLQEGLDPFMHKVWAATLAISCAITLVAAWWRDRVTGLLLERTGLTTMGVICPTYAVIVASQVGAQAGSVGVALTASLGIAGFWRVIHVNRELKILRTWMNTTYTDADVEEDERRD